MKRLIIQTTICYLTCLTVVLLLNEILLERQSWVDIFGLSSSSFIYLLVLMLGLYLPFLKFFMNRSYSRNFIILFYGFLLNVPFFIFAVLMTGIAFKATEAVLFSFMYLVTGTYFGMQVNKRKAFIRGE